MPRTLNSVLRARRSILATRRGATGGRPSLLPRALAARMPAVTRSPMSDASSSANGTDDREHRSAHRAVRIDLILHADEADAEMFELLERGQQMGGAAREAI